MTDENMAAEQAVSAAERMESLDSVEDFDPLDVKFEVNMRGTVSKVVAVTTTGGPHVEVDLTTGTVTASWGADTHTTHFDETGVAEQVEEHYRRMFEENILA